MFLWNNQIEVMVYMCIYIKYIYIYICRPITHDDQFNWNKISQTDFVFVLDISVCEIIYLLMTTLTHSNKACLFYEERLLISGYSDQSHELW